MPHYRHLRRVHQDKARRFMEQAAAELTAVHGYQPAPDAGPDLPAEWACRPDHLAPFRCPCGARFHVRRHLEAHQTTHERTT